MKKIIVVTVGIVMMVALAGCANTPSETVDEKAYPSDEDIMSFLNDDEIVKVQAMLGSGWKTQAISVFVGESEKIDVKSDDFIQLGEYGSKKAIEITNKLHEKYGEDIEIIVRVNNAIAYTNGSLDESKFTDNVIREQ